MTALEPSEQGIRKANQNTFAARTAGLKGTTMATNTLLTLNMITKEAVRLWRNSNAFIQNIDKQYDSSFGVAGAKIGANLRIRLPNDFTVRTGAAASVQNTTEQKTDLAVATQKGVDVEFSSAERALSIDDFAERYLAPAVNNTAGAVASDIMSGVDGGVCNYVNNPDASGNALTPNADTVLSGGALLNMNSAPLGDRKVVQDPRTEARVVSSLAGLFNPSKEISRQYVTGQMATALGFDWFMDQTVLKHTAGTFSAGTVNGAGQSGTTLTVNAITGTLKKGDIITLAGVNAVNRITKQDTGELRQFVVTADVLNGATSIPIYPAITLFTVAYGTVTAAPANSAVISLVNKASGVERRNVAYAPQACTMVTADLELPGGVMDASRAVLDKISMRMITQYNISTDQVITRLDVLYGYLWVRPEWAVVIADKI